MEDNKNIFEDMKNDIFAELDKENDEFEKTYKEPEKMKSGFINTSLKAIIGWLLRNIDIEINIRRKGEIIIHYEWPKH